MLGCHDLAPDVALLALLAEAACREGCLNEGGILRLAVFARYAAFTRLGGLPKKVSCSVHM